MTIQSKQLLKQNLKKCSGCKEIKNTLDFHKCKTNYDGLKEYCKLCKKIKEQLRWLKIRNNIKEINRRKKAKKLWSLLNKEHCREYSKQYSSNRYKNDIEYRLLISLRNRLGKFIKRNSKSKRTIELLGCSVEFLKQHLESQFKPGMSWDNYGKWHIDHIKPCASFDLSKPEEQQECFHYTNLQPLWGEENLTKGSKYDTFAK